MPNTRFSQRLKNRLNEESKVQPNLRQPRAKQKPSLVVSHHQVQNKPNNSKQEKKATTERVKEREKDEDDTELYGTPYKNSDSSTSEKTETKSKRWETYTN